ncbi:unnamed protein product [Cuscuta epithymum]|uniref:RNase H type-1 domain-containing protein n=1 Tax=Cuscuta epithymum TaxID=186058 RepID=A0AAV0G8S7_9ASTE|nr:unnamed protein product [Cuscuta epithymum]
MDHRNDLMEKHMENMDVRMEELRKVVENQKHHRSRGRSRSPKKRGHIEGRKSSTSTGRSIRVRGRFAASTTEALAVREAVIWAGQAGWSSVVIESDALSVVQGIATSDGIAYEDSIFAEIRHMIASLLS